MPAPLNSGNVTSAVVTWLQADATLKGLLPDGVYTDVAPPGSKRYVLITILDHVDRAIFQGTAWETFRYLVTGVGLTTVVTGPQMTNAAFRIHELLEQASIPVTGYPAPATLARLRIEDFKEQDKVDASLIWIHRGGHYLCHAPH